MTRDDSRRRHAAGLLCCGRCSLGRAVGLGQLEFSLSISSRGRAPPAHRYSGASTEDRPRGVAPRGCRAPVPIGRDEKTRRDAKDWGQVATLGHFLLDAGEARGLLPLQDAEELMERLVDVHPDAALIVQRPALRLAEAHSDQPGAALETERRFWRFFDAGRLAVSD